MTQCKLCCKKKVLNLPKPSKSKGLPVGREHFVVPAVRRQHYANNHILMGSPQATLLHESPPPQCGCILAALGVQSY